MTDEHGEETHRAVGVDGTLSAHARLVEFFVEWDDGVILLANLREGKERLLSVDEFEDRVAQGFATRLASPIAVDRGESGLLLTAEIVEIVNSRDSDPLYSYEKRSRTEDSDVVVVGDIDELDGLVGELAEPLADAARTEIVRGVMKEIQSQDGQWERVERWVSYALHCAAGHPELQYRPILLRSWLLRRKIQSTQIRNFYQQFLAELLSWQEFQAQLDLLDRTVRAEADQRLWKEHSRRLEEVRRERIRDRDPSPGIHPRQAPPPLN